MSSTQHQRKNRIPFKDVSNIHPKENEISKKYSPRYKKKWDDISPKYQLKKENLRTQSKGPLLEIEKTKPNTTFVTDTKVDDVVRRFDNLFSNRSYYNYSYL